MTRLIPLIPLIPLFPLFPLIPLIRGTRAVIDAVLTPGCWACGDLLPRHPAHGLDLCPFCAALASRPARPLCPACGDSLPARPDIDPAAAPVRDRPCARCASSPPSFARARALFAYEGVAPRLVLSLKYGRASWLAAPLGRAMAAVALAEGLADADVVVPVPLGPGRHRRRGYNQACLLASSVARHLGLDLAPGALRRVRDPGPQDRRGRADRLARIRGCFAPGRPSSVHGRRVLLVDDVVTTGATAGECARVLLAAGAVSVDVLSLARAGCDAG